MTGLLAGRTALITGGGRGIGAAIAIAFAHEGARLLIASRSEAQLKIVAEQCSSVGAECTVSVADVSVQTAVSSVVSEAIGKLGTVDILVNAAGIYGPIGPIVEIDIDDWVRALHVNLLGTLFTCRAVLPTMIERRTGTIINFSGGGATSPLPRFSAYGVSKAAVVRLTETLAEEVAQYGIRVNAIAPGAVDTALQDEVLSAGERAGELYQRIAALREFGTGGTPISVPVDLAVFLASETSVGLTGRLISAPHDPWRDWDSTKIRALSPTPWYTLRRLDPFTLGSVKDGIP